MPAISASAPGKVILFGEHAVVYGHPAIAVPVTQVQAKAIVTADPQAPPGRVLIDAPDVELASDLANLAEDHPLAALLSGVRHKLDIPRLPAFRLRIRSSIPIAAGLGSGAAVSIATARAVSAFLGHPLSNELVSELAYDIEKLYHLTPSGIDNTVITYARPIYFRRGYPVEFLDVAEPFTLVIADSGVKSLTREVVASVRQGWETDPKVYEAMFDAIASITNTARQLMEQRGSLAHLGDLLNENHNRLQALGVSCPELDQLVSAARKAGALGAKLSGAGRGGNMIALVSPNQAPLVAAALEAAGAVRTLITTVDSRLNRE